MSPPVISPTVTPPEPTSIPQQEPLPAAEGPTPPLETTIATQGNATPPYRLEINSGYMGQKFGHTLGTFSGPFYGARLGQNFPHGGKHQFLANAVFRQGFLKNKSSEQAAPLSVVHFGIEAGYEWNPSPWFSASILGGIGSNIYNSARIGTLETDATPIPVTNDAALSFTLGAGISLAKGILNLGGSFQSSFGLQLTPDEKYPQKMGVNPLGYNVQVGLDLAKITAAAGGQFALPVASAFTEGLSLGLLIDGSYTHSFNEPRNHINAYRVFDSRSDRPMMNLAQLSLLRPSDEAYPFGFGLVLDTGENPGVSGAADSFNGDYYDLQQAWGEIRLPIGNGLTLRAGKIATPIGLEVLEPINAQLSRSMAFGYAIPFTHMGAILQYPINDAISLHAGVVNGWDNVLGRDSGPSAIMGIKAQAHKRLFLSAIAATGVESGRFRSVADLIATLDYNPFTLTFNLDWGHEGSKGDDLPKADWVAASLSPQIKIHDQFSLSGRAEFFHDPQGARTGTPQTLGSEIFTAHVRPLPKKYHRFFPLEIRAEVRHDHSTDLSFLRGQVPWKAQTTFGIGLTLYYDNLLSFKRSR